MATCMFPYYVENPVPMNQSEVKIPVPCGRCPECLKRRASIWGFRLRKQEQISVSSHFLTLTYDTEHIPLSKNGFMTLDKTDFQNFMKRLRKISPKLPKISYYACGEYGGRRRRPHYHAIIFNSDEQLMRNAWMLDQNPIGIVHVGSVSGASIAYVLKYMNKGYWQPDHRNDDRNPEFALMSKGMGANYLTDEVIKHHKSDLQKAYILLEDGIKMAIPRYYKDKLFTENERKIQNALVKQLKEAEIPSYMSDRDRFEAKKSAINNFRKKHLNRKDL